MGDGLGKGEGATVGDGCGSLVGTGVSVGSGVGRGGLLPPLQPQRVTSRTVDGSKRFTATAAPNSTPTQPPSAQHYPSPSIVTARAMP